MSVEAEKKAIEAILHDNTLLDELVLYDDDFEDRTNRLVFTAVSDLINSGVKADIMSVYSSGKVDASVMTGYEPFTGANARYYADMLKEKTKRRKIALLTKRVIDLLKTKNESNEIIGEIEAEIYRIQERKDNEVRHVKEFMFPAISEIEDAYQNGTRISGVLSLYNDLDNVLLGFHGGDIIVLAARTSIGKTAFALNMAENIAVNGDTVIFFSCEMSGNQIVKRMMSSLGGIDHKRLVNGNLGDKKVFDSMMSASSRIMESKLYIDDTPNISFAELRAKSRIMKRKGAKIIFIDYLTLIKYGNVKTPRFERVGELVREIKALARELDVPIIVLSQLNRDAEESRPTLAGLRQSGEIEEHADVILFLHRERGEALTDLIVAKHRNGMTGDVPLYFDEGTVRFRPGTKNEYGQ